MICINVLKSGKMFIFELTLIGCKSIHNMFAEYF